MSKKLFYRLLRMIRKHLLPSDDAMKHIYNKKLIVPPRRKLLIALWFLTHGGDWNQVAVAGSVGTATARKYVIQVFVL